MSSPIRWEQDGDGVVTLVLDDPQQRVNTMNDAFMQALFSTVERLESQIESISGVILRSGKRSFLAGGDLNRLFAVDLRDKDEFAAGLNERKSFTSRLELLGRPVVALLAGPALGGGLELALCCHHRIAVDNGRTTVGLPEVNLGLMPGAGGVVRTVRLLGPDVALDHVLLSGRRFGPMEAASIGLIDCVVETEEMAETAARKWIRTRVVQPARSEPSNGHHSARVSPMKAHPGKQNLIRVAEFAAQGNFDQALEFETEAFADLAVSEKTKNMIRINFFESTRVRNRAKADSSAERQAKPVLVTHSDSAELVATVNWSSVVESVANTSPTTAAEFTALHVDPATPVESQVWLSPDYVGDGQLVLEYRGPGSPEFRASISTLAAKGVIAIELGPAGRSFALHIRTALAAAVRSAVSHGVTELDVRTALDWADFDTRDITEIGLVSEVGYSETNEAAITELAHSLLTEVAASAIDAIECGALAYAADADVASVRAGGFPAWTGGVRTWATRGSSI